MTEGEMTDRVRVNPVHDVRAMAGHRAPILRAGLAIVLLGGTAWAADRGTAEERRACTPDVLKRCNEFIPDAERITVCLREKLRELSPACRVVMIGARRR